MKTILTLTVLAVAGGITYIALFFYEPEVHEVVHERVQSAVDTIASPVPTVEQARAELAAANKKLDEEEARLLADIDRATSTAATKIAELEMQIAAIEADRDMEVESIEGKLSEINDVRVSFR